LPVLDEGEPLKRVARLAMLAPLVAGLLSESGQPVLDGQGPSGGVQPGDVEVGAVAEDGRDERLVSAGHGLRVGEGAAVGHAVDAPIHRMAVVVLILAGDDVLRGGHVILEGVLRPLGHRADSGEEGAGEDPDHCQQGAMVREGQAGRQAGRQAGEPSGGCGAVVSLHMPMLRSKRKSCRAAIWAKLSGTVPLKRFEER
jgi:hypothetical protein